LGGALERLSVAHGRATARTSGDQSRRSREHIHELKITLVLRGKELLDNTGLDEKFDESSGFGKKKKKSAKARPIWEAATKCPYRISKLYRQIRPAFRPRQNSERP